MGWWFRRGRGGGSPNSVSGGGRTGKNTLPKAHNGRRRRRENSRMKGRGRRRETVTGEFSFSAAAGTTTTIAFGKK